MVEELDVIKMVVCPSTGDFAEADDCCFCRYNRGMGAFGFTLFCGFEDKELNEEHKDD